MNSINVYLNGAFSQTIQTAVQTQQIWGNSNSTEQLHGFFDCTALTVMTRNFVTTGITYTENYARGELSNIFYRVFSKYMAIRLHTERRTSNRPAKTYIFI